MDTKPEPLLSRLILTPVLFITFLVSLLFVDRKAYSQVVAGHVPQDSYYHSHQRKLARREVEDAFHMRNRAMAALLIATGIGLALLGWTGSKVIHALFPARVVIWTVCGLSMIGMVLTSIGPVLSLFRSFWKSFNDIFSSGNGHDGHSGNLSLLDISHAAKGSEPYLSSSLLQQLVVSGKNVDAGLL